MVNFIRACFCLNQNLDFIVLNKLLEVLAQHDCHAIGSTETNFGVWVEQKMEWTIRNKPQKARLFQLSQNHGGYSLVSFDIDEFLLLPESKISYRPDSDPLFAAYKTIIVDLIKQLKPRIGLIDYEADLLCTEIPSITLASWGNFFPYDFLKLWSLDERNMLTQLVDELIPIDEFGLLTFIHPLLANQAWSERHEQLERIIRTHRSHLMTE